MQAYKRLRFNYKIICVFFSFMNYEYNHFIQYLLLHFNKATYIFLNVYKHKIEKHIVDQ